MSATNGAVNGQAGSKAANLPSHFIGGNHLDAAPPSAVRDFVAKHEGHSVISSVSCPGRSAETWEAWDFPH